ncbi:hypothetical protein HMPREF3039_00939 [Akkermansia sp. KLE1798]|nr:hypothetical protein HMPREF3039_00939 [Akkermansia sp. KLE1798]
MIDLVIIRQLSNPFSGMISLRSLHQSTLKHLNFKNKKFKS